MRGLRIPLGVSLFVWSLCGIAVSTVQGALLDAVPATASVVVRWKSPQATLDKLGDFVDEVQPGVGAVVRSGMQQLGQAFSNPEMKGIDVSQDVWVIVFAEPQAIPTVVFVMTAKDVDDVKDALDSNFEFHSVGKLIAYSLDEDALSEVSKRLAGEGKAIWSTIDPATKKLFDAAEVSVLVNLKQLTEDFSDELDQAGPQLDAFLDQLTTAIPDEPDKPRTVWIFQTVMQFLRPLRYR